LRDAGDVVGFLALYLTLLALQLRVVLRAQLGGRCNRVAQVVA
jgi:hypothetical protein